MLTLLEGQDIVLTRTRLGMNRTGSIRIHRNVVSPKFQRWQDRRLASKRKKADARFLPALCVNPLTANLLAEYAEPVGYPNFPAMELAPIMRPPRPCAIICIAANL